MTAYPDFTGYEPCRTTDPDVWFPDVGGSSRFAVALCHTCEIEAACLAWVLDQPRDVPGVFGGTTQQQRKRMRRRAA